MPMIPKFLLPIILLPILLVGCNGFFDKDNTPDPTPLASFTPEVKPTLLWSTKTGSGSGNDYLKIGPAMSHTTLFTTSVNGTVTAIDKTNGQIRWEVSTHVALIASPGIGEDLVIVGSRQGDVIALQQADGKQRWKVNIAGEILARPAIANNVAIIKAMDGTVRALSIQDGHERWSFQQVEPSLILRAESAPLIYNRSSLIGFANGNLAKLSLNEGQLQWMQTIAVPEGAFAIQRMIDIDADPLLFKENIYVATYQGKIAALNMSSGRIRWSRDISSYTGMIASENFVYLSDANSHLWAFNTNNGALYWQQSKLAYRIVSGPAIMGNYIVVGDAQGYLHWLNKNDGHIAAREHVRSAIYAAPIVDNNVLYALTSNGNLFAYTLSPQ